MAAMSMLAVPWVARRCFAGFYKSHIFFALAVGIMALTHGFGSATFSGRYPKSVPGTAFWLIDILVRSWFLNCAHLPA
jgi:hypothetical protein